MVVFFCLLCYMTCFYLISMSDLERMLGAAELLSEMLRAVDPNDQDVSIYILSLFLYMQHIVFC